VREVLATEPAIVGGDKDAEIEDIAVEFRGVSFSYPSSVGAPVLCGIDLKIKRGEVFAIVGDTGSGKTSLVNLTPRFYDATDGKVLVGGLNVKDYKLSGLRKKIGFVMQRSELFSGSIRENIIWGKDGASDSEIDEALTVASADSFVSAIAEGKEARVAEKGTSLSGGQKQRLSIARAVIRRPDILILDDATSALDLSTEARVRSAIREKMSDSTIIMIAQRIASVKHADRIAVIENGRISACGNHDELMATSEVYRDIYASQMRAGGADNE
jgi:ATP-binding cassette subfamily B protein